MVLMVLVPTFIDARDAGRAARGSSPQPTPSSSDAPTTQQQPQLSFTLSEVCRAGIAALMGREPSIISARQVGGIAHLSYVRPDDGTRWSYRCRLVGARILWASDTGRWRTHPADEVMSFNELSLDQLEVRLHFSDGSSAIKSYSRVQLGS